MEQQQACMIDALDAPAAGASKGASVLARLAEREEARAATAAKRLEDLQVSGDPHESVDSFMEEFAAKQQQLEGAVQAAALPQGSSAAHLAALVKQIVELEKVVADATYFLPAYDLRQATQVLAALREQQEAAAAALQPRKRFAFNRKATKAPAAEEQPAAANGINGAAPGKAAATAGQQQPQVEQQAEKQDMQQPLEQQQQHVPPSSGSVVTSIRGLRGQVLALGREQAAGKEFTLSDLEGCAIYLLAPLAALFLHGLRRCQVFTGPVAGACFVEGASDSVLMIAAHQVRIHSAAATDFYLRVRSHPIIEHSAGLRFAPYAPSYPGAWQDLEEQGLGQDEAAMWRQVNDFGWLRATPSPHWQELPAASRLPAPAAAAAATAGGCGSRGA